MDNIIIYVDRENSIIIENDIQDDVSCVVSGSQGIPGTNGSVIYHGVTTPSDNIGGIGDYYFDTFLKNIHGPKTTVWPSGINLSESPKLPVEFIYDSSGNLTRINKSVTDYKIFSYDSNGILTSVTDGSSTWTYNYNSNGILTNIGVS